MSRELSLHPIHLTPDKEGNLPPSALVPFCLYQGESSILGREVPDMDNITVCDKFQPTILDGQVCHTLDTVKLREHPTKPGKANGLLLLIDPKPYQVKHKDGAEDFKMDGKSFKVSIHTLAQYTMFGPGSYAMSTLKKTTGTSNFKDLPDHQKKCLDHNKEECQTQKYLDRVKKECKCIPWTVQTYQVTLEWKIEYVYI